MPNFSKNYKVTGLSKHDFARIVDNIRVGTTVELRRDTNNVYDDRATGVWINNRQIGWIPKSSNADISAVLDYPCDKRITANISRFEGVKSPIWETPLEISVYISLDLPASTQYITTKLSNGTKGSIPLSNTSNTVLSNMGNQGKAEIDYGDKYLDTDAYKQQYWTGSVSQDRKNQELEEQLRKKVKEIKEINENRSTIKENKMGTVDKMVDTNKMVATQAAFQEAGRIALNQITKVATKQAPLMVKGYIDTPAGKLVIANMAVMAVNQFRPNDQKLQRLTQAALQQAYQEMYQSFDIEKFIAEFVDNSTIKSALNQIEAD